MKKFKFFVAFNVLISIVFFAGLFAGFYHVRDAIMWYSVNKSSAASTVSPTGYDVLVELNKYRVANDLPKFELYQPLCNNIGERWDNYKANNSHKGFLEFVNKWMPGMYVEEILTAGKTPEEMVKGWTSSPSHDLAIRNNSKICVYSAQGLAVALLTK